MNKLARAFCMTLLSLSIVPSFGHAADAAPPCEKIIEVFLQEPDAKTFHNLTVTKHCRSVIVGSNGALEQLIKNTENGSAWSAQYLAQTLKLLDGSTLKDGQIALGEFSEQNMKAFLGFEKSGQLSKHDFIDALTTLPLAVSDDVEAQLDELAVRKINAINIKQTNLSNQKKLAIRAIDAFAYEVSSNKEQEPTTEEPRQ